MYRKGVNMKASKVDWRDQVYIPGLESLGIQLAVFLGLQKADYAMCSTFFHRLQSAFARAGWNKSFVQSNNRSKALLNTGIKDAFGFVFMLMTGNTYGGYQRYMFTGKFCRESDIDPKEFARIPGKRDLDVNPLDVVNLDAEVLTIGSFHIIKEHPERIGRYLNGKTYKECNDELSLCIRASIAYAKSNSKILELNTYNGRLQVVIPFVDREHRICRDLSVVLEYKRENDELVVPTILNTVDVMRDRKCDLCSAPHAAWVKLYGSAA